MVLTAHQRCQMAFSKPNLGRFGVFGSRLVFFFFFWLIPFFINFTHRAETFFWSHPLDCSTSPLGTAHVQLAKVGRIRSIHGFRVIWQGSKNYKTEGLRQKKRSHEDK
jgi:hypothetical protein